MLVQCPIAGDSNGHRRRYAVEIVARSPRSAAPATLARWAHDADVEAAFRTHWVSRQCCFLGAIRHTDTDYDELLMAGVPRDEARERVRRASTTSLSLANP
ncbi:DUF2293 domain-containing protein [Jiangella asiatica]|uniref:DUF2293 domain-containing protein n=1 Tax=Jiangella asiatica TaxID=2530372 RepID=A0A4R5DM01_9ACTN|nr:DUF2293 domain-containing protein [Jiangella asiatica]